MAQARLAVIMPRMSRYGGAEGFGLRLASALAGAGHAVDFICGRRECEAPAGVNVVQVGRFGPSRLAKTLWFALEAQRLCRLGRYDLTFGLGRTLGQDVLRVGGGPLPVFWRLSSRSYAAGLPRIFKALRRRLRPSNILGLWLEKRQIKGDPLVVAVSDLARNWFLEAHPEVRPQRVRVIYNRPDLDRFSILPEARRAELRRAAGVADGDVLVLTAGTNFALKGVAPLLRAMALTPPNFRLHVAGGRGAGPYLKLAEGLGLTGRVRFLGRVDDMAGFYNTGDIFCLPTFFDACSNALLEALACGLPAISSAMNGSAVFLPKDCVFPDPDDAPFLASLLVERAKAGRGNPFVWPESVVSGMQPWLDLATELLAARAAGRRP